MKRILITGATSGIGQALAQYCALQGYKVIACGRNQQKLTELANHQQISTLCFDVTDKQQVKAALREAVADIYVLNAGVCEYVNVEAFDSTLFERVFAVNFFGNINVIECILGRLKSSNQIVIVDSLARLLPFSRCQAYGASKAAIHYLSESLSTDLSPKGVLVQSVSPGFVETPLTDKNDFDMPMKISATEAARRLLTAIEKQQRHIYFPRIFSSVVRFAGNLPASWKRRLCKQLNTKEASST